jgi:hypothetical protein
MNSARKPHIRLHGKEGLPSESEQLVAAAWAEVLGYSEFQIDDQFFDIGGNSILILKVHSLIERNRPGTVELPDLFAYPTIATLAGHIDAQLGRKAEDMEAGGAAAAATAAAAAAETEEDGDLELLIERLALGELSVSGAVSALTKGKAGERHE